MDNNSWRVAPAQAQGQPQISGQVMGGAGQVMGGEVAASQGMDAGDWRNQLQPDSRQRIVNKIMDTLKRHLPFSGQEGLLELKKIAIRFEEKIYAAATSQSDYLRKISLKMLTMETKSQPGGVNNKNPQEQGSQSMQPQMQNQVQSQPNQMGSNQPQVRQQQLLNQQNNNMASSNGAPNSTPTITSQGTNMPGNGIGQNPNMQQDISGVVNQNPSANPMGGPSNGFANSQRQIPTAGRQQQQDQFMYNQQLQQHLMKQKMQQGGGMPQSHMQSQMQQNQNVLQPNQLQSSQNVSMQPSLRQSAPSSNLQQNQQQTSLQQSNQSLIQPQSQNVLRQMQQPMMHQQQNSMSTQQQIQPNSANMQQNQLIGQHNGMLDAQQQQQQQQQRMIAQQQNNNISNMQQQNNVPNVHQQSNSGQQNLHQQQVGQNNGFQNQQMGGLQHGNSGMQVNQQQMMQNKVNMQQNMGNIQQNLLPNQAQAQQSQSQAPQMMSQIQSQPGQMQQQIGLQQRMQNPGSLLQQQNAIDQQRQLLQQSQRVMPDVPLNSSSHSGTTNGGDLQEEIYQKIKSMNEKYFPELNDMFQRMAIKLQQVDVPLQPSKNEQVEKLRFFVTMLEKLILFLRTNKNEIVPSHREKSVAVEKQIVNILSSHRPKKPVSSLQQQQGQVQGQGQVFSQSNIHSIQQQSQPPQMHDNLMNVQTPPQHNSNIVNNSRQNQMDPSIDPGQGNSMNSMQQGGMNSMQQNPVMNSVPSSSIQGAQSLGMNSLQANPNMQVKQEQQIYTTQQMKHQQYQRQMQQQQFQMQRQQLLQQQQQNNQMNDTQDIKMRPQQQMRPVLQQNQRPHMVKPGNSFSISSPQLFQSGSPQIGHHPSPQLDQQNMSNNQIRTPSQQANSPFIVPSPSISMVPSPLPGGDLEKINSSLMNTGNNNVQHQSNAGASAQPQSLAIGTPGISASPLLAEFTSPDGTTHGAISTVVAGNSTSVELPLDRLIKAVKSMTPKALTSSVSDIGSVVSMVDRIAGSAPGNGSRAAVGEDLVAMTKCRLQARNFFAQDGPSGTTKKMRRYTSAVPSNVVSSTGSVTDNIMYLNGCESDGESTGASSVIKPKLEVNYALQEELREINERLIDTVVFISEDDVDPTAVAAATEGGEGTIVKCNYSAVALSPNLKSQYDSAQMSPIQPLRLLIPGNYPNCSPILLDKFPIEISKEYEDLSLKVKSRFSISLRTLGEPMSLGEIARTWDVCARAVITEYAQQSGGGSFSSNYGTWQNCA